MLPPERQTKFFEISKQMAKLLRKEIMNDQGTSLLKKRTLDLITSLRLENKQLPDQPAPEAPPLKSKQTPHNEPLKADRGPSHMVSRKDYIAEIQRRSIKIDDFDPEADIERNLSYLHN